MILEGTGSSEISPVYRNSLEFDPGLISHWPIIFEPRREVLALADIEGLELMAAFSYSFNADPGDSNAASY